MKKNLLLSSALLLAASTMTAAAPEGDLYLNAKGLMSEEAPATVGTFVMGERSEDDIEEGYWRWTIESLELTENPGCLTVTGADGFSLGYYEDNPFDAFNMISSMQRMTYLTPGGEEVFYMLNPGEYRANLVLMEDIDGDMGGDTWMLALYPLAEEADENFYLLGFDGVGEPAATVRFVKEEVEADGEVSYIYNLPHIYLSDCENGFTVLDSASETVYGAGENSMEMSEDAPMTFLVADGTPVAWTLKDGYYDVKYVATGAMNIITFNFCEDQTANEDMEYYLVGVNGSEGLKDEYKFTRKVEVTEYEDEDTGDLVSYETVSYTLTAEISGECELTVVSAGNVVTYGYNTDMSMFLPNDLSNESSFAGLAQNGEPLNCSLEPGKYNFTVMITGSSATLMAESAEDGAVEGVEIDSDAAPVYYNLQGQRVMNPSKGIFIEKRGAKTAKVIF